MLDNELVGLKETLRELEPDRTLSIAKANKIRRTVKAHSARAEQNWSLALFSELPDDTLVRYFTFHQQLIAEVLENLAEVSDLTFKYSTCPALNRQLADFASAVLHSLLNHLLDRYRLYVNLELPAPKYFQQQCCRVWASTWNAVSKLWYEQPFDPPLRALLWSFVEQFEVNPQNLRHSYRTLGYVKELVMQLAGLEAYKSMASWSDAVITILLNANFNALDFFLYQQQLILDALQALDYREQLDYLHRLQQDYFVHLESNVPPYDARFP